MVLQQYSFKGILKMLRKFPRCFECLSLNSLSKKFVLLLLYDSRRSFPSSRRACSEKGRY